MSLSRIPVEAPPPRMAALARLPVFFALAGKRALLAGGTSAAAWKAELLSAAGATLDVFATDLSDEMQALADEPPNGPIVVHARAWAPQDFAGAAIAVGAFDDEAEAGRFAAAARAAGVPVNVIDKPAFCDFSFGSIVNRSPLVIGISTDGAAPVFAQAIRAKLEAILPRGFARLGGSGAALARRREIVRAVVRGAPAILAAIHRSRTGPSGSGARASRFRRPARCHTRPGRGRWITAPSRWSAPAPAIPNCSRCARCARCNPPT